MAGLEPTDFRVENAGLRLSGEALGEGTDVVLLHGLTATRDQVVHGSKTLAREGFRQITYDARGHGESDPAGADTGYGYPELVADLAAVVEHEATDGRLVLGGHSMGAHTAVSYALGGTELLAALIVIGPVVMDGERDLERWEALADALEREGIEGFLEVIGRGMDPAWRDTVLRFTRARMERHRYLDAMVRALREVPRSCPFDSPSDLQQLDVPTLVVASHDVADPHHPYAIAEAYAESIPGARLISEEEGESPLAWQGGRLSRAIVGFCREPAVMERLG